jgi:catechol 2,3-dioxygenase-like lactoylglutathione lyase family enzyme
MPAIALHHVQVAIPIGEEDRARAFYSGVLGLVEIPKPINQRERGGLWFRVGALELHIGVEKDFRPAKKAHPALLVDDLAAVSGLATAAGHATRPDTMVMEGYDRLFVDDPFGNRVELLQRSRTEDQRSVD